ncbi:TonB-dependent receptor [Bacteroides neonati]|uniref:TonB-dependent receptor n=1 Tax=Bacteroides neonati TaxID=1347393 RepID=UPI0005A89048|nr:TonB-dependent receptor [Bacteroides neonati]
MIKILFFLLPFSTMVAAGEPDTVLVKRVNLDEVTIVGFKQKKPNREPLSISTLDNRFLKENEILGAKDLSSLLPNFYMPDYGSKQNSPVYIRGIGAKKDAPSVGFYVDGIPHFETSAFDIDLSDISSVEVLRGPQGTLYGRNSIGGIINVYTHSPLDYQGTRFRLGYGSYNDIRLMASNYTKVNERLGLSFSGNYHHNDGFFTNLYTGKKADKLDNGSGRIGLVWKPANRWTTRFIASYEHLNQGGYPYGLYNADNGTTEAVNYNQEGLYRRNLLTSGANVRYDGARVSFNSQTSYQYIHDKMGIDQDFSPRSESYVQNRIQQHMYSQEFTVKSVGDSRYQWITGAFAFRQTVDREVNLSRFTNATRDLTNSEIPTQGIAFYHQSTLDLYGGLSCSVGLRYDYEHARCDFSKVRQPLEGKGATKSLGQFDRSLHFSQFTPKFSLQYLSSHQQLLYASVARGYKTGGFNVSIQNDADYLYSPEYNWNYEIGAKLSFLNDKLIADLGLFYIDWRNQQITNTIPDLGNIIRNAGRSHNKGVEVSLQARPAESLVIHLNYGYTDARFIRYEKEERGGVTDYGGNYLPMVPRHTFSLTAGYTLYGVCSWIDRLSFNGGVSATGPIYWYEDNQAKQNLYALVNLKIGASKGRFTWEVWSKNLTNTDYLSYYFVTRKAYAQKGKPITLGTSVSIRL